MATAINVFGGVDIDISKSEFKYINAFITETVKGTGIGTTQLKSPGMNHLDGVQAVAYARLRKMDTDYQRTERQRLVIKLTMDKAKEASLTTLLGTVDLIFPMISTNVDMGDCIDLAKNFSRYYLGETTGFPFDKDSKVMGKKGDCVIPLNLETNVQQLHQFLFGGNEDGSPYTPSSTVKTISKKIINDSGWDKNSTSSGGGSDKASSTKAPETQAPTASVTEVIVDGESNGEGEFQVPTDENGNPIPTESGESMEFVEGGESGSAFESGSGSETQGPGFDGPGGSGTRPGQTTEEYGPGVTKPSTEPGTLAPEETLPSSSEGTTTTPGSTGTSTTPGTQGPSGSTTTPGSPTTPGTPGTSGSQTSPGSPTAPGTSGSSVTPGSGSGNSPAGNGPGGSPVSSTAASPEVPQGPQGSTQAPPEAQVNIETVPPRAQ